MYENLFILHVYFLFTFLFFIIEFYFTYFFFYVHFHFTFLTTRRCDVRIYEERRRTTHLKCIKEKEGCEIILFRNVDIYISF